MKALALSVLLLACIPQVGWAAEEEKSEDCLIHLAPYNPPGLLASIGIYAAYGVKKTLCRYGDPDTNRAWLEKWFEKKESERLLRSLKTLLELAYSRVPKIDEEKLVDPPAKIKENWEQTLTEFVLQMLDGTEPLDFALRQSEFENTVKKRLIQNLVEDDENTKSLFARVCSLGCGETYDILGPVFKDRLLGRVLRVLPLLDARKVLRLATAKEEVSELGFKMSLGTAHLKEKASICYSDKIFVAPLITDFLGFRTDSVNVISFYQKLALGQKLGQAQEMLAQWRRDEPEFKTAKANELYETLRKTGLFAIFAVVNKLKPQMLETARVAVTPEPSVGVVLLKTLVGPFEELIVTLIVEQHEGTFRVWNYISGRSYVCESECDLRRLLHGLCVLYQFESVEIMEPKLKTFDNLNPNHNLI